MRQLSMGQLAWISGVSKSDISRIEAGKRDPGWLTMSRLLRAAGYRVGEDLTESGSDDLIVWLLEQYYVADLMGRRELLAEFETVGLCCPILERMGSRWVQLDVIQDPRLLPGNMTGDLPTMLDLLESQGQEPILSNSEALCRTREMGSFWPIVYVNAPEAVTGVDFGRRLGGRRARLVTTTDNVRRYTIVVKGTRYVSDEWAILDGLGAMDRTADYALAEVGSRATRLGWGLAA
jgi:transcriptional regulator with XRE-family HTH domain